MNRAYIPLSFYEPEAIAHDSTLTVADATEYHFGILSSDMFMTWVRTVAGRLKSDFRLSSELVYNTFPWPEVSDRAEQRVSELARAVLGARAQQQGATLADLYDTSSMPAVLVRAHTSLDKAVASLYGRSTLPTELTRQAKLFDRYTVLTQT